VNPIDIAMEGFGGPCLNADQAHAVELLDRSENVFLSGVAGTGKCLGHGTPVLMADGRVLPVERVWQGDRLVGPDGRARTVLGTSTGWGPLYRVIPKKGGAWVCNDVHVMTLVRSSRGDGRPVDIPLDKWMAMGPSVRYDYKLFSVGVGAFEGAPADLPVDPYFLGLWFGDGTKATRALVEGGEPLAITKPDPEVRVACDEAAAAWGLRVVVRGEAANPTLGLVGMPGARNGLLDAIRDLVGTRMVVPNAYTRAPREQRLAFLAGFLDADAELSCNCFIITQKRRDWAEAIWFTARSLGFCATITTRTSRSQDGYEGIYHVVTISGDVDLIPTRIPRRQASPRRQIKGATRTGFDVEPLGDGAYYGFTLDGDGRFLLGDFTVTHNTYALNAWLDQRGRDGVAVTASTGIAATHLNGCTIHSWSGCGIGSKPVKRIVNSWWWKENVAPTIRAADAVVIDEISMLDGVTFELIGKLCERARPHGKGLPFGGLQVVLVGDMGQLAPVEEEKKGFPFETDLWWDLGLHHIELTRVMRQRDAAFVHALQDVRNGTLGEHTYALLEGCVGAYNPDAEDACRLMTHNRQVDKVNAARLAQVPGEVRVFEADDYSKDGRAMRQLDRNCLSPARLELKVGARVMMTKNGWGYANGSLGYVVGYEDPDEAYMDEDAEPAILVRLDGSEVPIRVGRAIWRTTKMEAVPTGKKNAQGKPVTTTREVTAARRKQYPLRLAWAITIHKSQGMTLEKVSVDLERCFAPGQAYVALSRAKSLEGLNIEAWRGARSIIAHPTVGAFVRGDYRLPQAPDPQAVTDAAAGMDMSF